MKDLLQRRFNCTGWDTVDVGILQFYDVVFIEDFGAFKKGESHSCVMVDLLNGSFQSLSKEDGSTIKTVKYDLQAIS